MTAAQTVYTDDADAFVAWTVTDTEGNDLDWATPQIAVGDNDYATASWEGVADSTREIRLSMPDALDLTPARYQAYLKVPNGNDFPLGPVIVRDRV